VACSCVGIIKFQLLFVVMLLLRLRCCCDGDGYTNPDRLTILHTQYSTFFLLNWVRGGGEEGA
jgi:hypothetical protein